MTTWTPVLGGATATEARRVLDELQRPIARLARRRRAFRPRSATLSSGLPGLALACAYADGVRARNGWDGLAEALLEPALELAPSLTRAGLFGGLAGLAFVTSHLLGAGDEDPGLELDALLLEVVHAGGIPYDLIGGLAGLGVSALERVPQPSAEALVRAVIRELALRAEPSGDGVTWRTQGAFVDTTLVADAGAGYHNLGMAHGVAGVLGFLAEATRRGFAEARPLVEGAATWLWRQRRPVAGAPAFGSVAAPGVTLRPPRSAWCYGDVGVALALYGAGVALEDREWRGRAIDVARAAAELGPDAALVRDASLCHGEAGVAHAFLRLHKASGDATLRLAATRWLERLVSRGARIAYARPPHHPAVFLGLLKGVAGVILVLSAAIGEAEPCWDRLLLAGLPMAAE